MAAIQLDEIYQVVVGKIKNVPPRTFWIAVDIGQLETDGEMMPLKYPAVLLKFADVMWKESPPGYQMGLVNVAIKFVYKFKSESQFYTNNSSEITDCLTILLSIHDAINLTTGATFSELRRYNQYQQKTNPTDLLWVHVIQYRCNIQSNGSIDNPTNLDIDFDEIRNNNYFLERHRFNLLHK